jgi:hypothetical protein
MVAVILPAGQLCDYNSGSKGRLLYTIPVWLCERCQVVSPLPPRFLRSEDPIMQACASDSKATQPPNLSAEPGISGESAEESKVQQPNE